MKARFTQEQIIGLLKQHGGGRLNGPDLPGQQGVAGDLLQMEHPGGTRFGGMDVDEAKRLKQLEEENVRLKRIVADQALDIVALKDVLSDIVFPIP